MGGDCFVGPLMGGEGEVMLVGSGGGGANVKRMLLKGEGIVQWYVRRRTSGVQKEESK